MEEGRFFHRMLPAGNQLLILGGANMDVGKYAEVGMIKLPGGKKLDEQIP